MCVCVYTYNHGKNDTIYLKIYKRISNICTKNLRTHTHTHDKFLTSPEAFTTFGKISAATCLTIDNIIIQMYETVREPFTFIPSIVHLCLPLCTPIQLHMHPHTQTHPLTHVHIGYVLDTERSVGVHSLSGHQYNCKM